MARALGLTDLQLDIMRVLWTAGEASVADVHRALKARHLAHATVATLLSRLEKKGAIAHTTEGRQFIYRPVLKQAEVRKSMMARVRDVLYAEDVPALISQLLADRDITRDELTHVKALIEAKEKELAARARTSRKSKER
ncbi:MAG TPA: BlaI/MecI/CopY family transcriptional regulator [Gemmatimonadaceae bacterium]|jgi:predicted transcriptional regulator|nr:BlaI/MecI/CopY family transcriptional regulator [Gemmatimonadaceae bacterium]